MYVLSRCVRFVVVFHFVKWILELRVSNIKVGAHPRHMRVCVLWKQPEVRYSPLPKTWSRVWTTNDQACCLRRNYGSVLRTFRATCQVSSVRVLLGKLPRWPFFFVSPLFVLVDIPSEAAQSFAARPRAEAVGSEHCP